MISSSDYTHVVIDADELVLTALYIDEILVAGRELVKTGEMSAPAFAHFEELLLMVQDLAARSQTGEDCSGELAVLGNMLAEAVTSTLDDL